MPLRSYSVSTDAVTVTIKAFSLNHAAEKFAARFDIYHPFKVKTVADLVAAAKSLGGWAAVTPSN